MEPPIMSYIELLKKQAKHPVRLAEVPLEHALSLPLPTKRCGTPGYAFFASPTVRADARSEHLPLDAPCEAMPFSQGETWKPESRTPRNRSLAPVEKEQAELVTMLTAQAPSSLPANPALEQDVMGFLNDWSTSLPEPLLTQYRAWVRTSQRLES